MVGPIAGAGIGVSVMPGIKDRQSSASYATGGCAAGQVKVHVWPLPKPEQGKGNVYNGTGTAKPDAKAAKKNPGLNGVPGLAPPVADDLRNPGFGGGKGEEDPEDHHRRGKPA